MEVKIAKIQLSITANGTPKAYIWNEGSDINSLSQAIEIIGDECIYLATRQVGEVVEIIEKGKWKNVSIPQAYREMLENPSYNRVKLLFKRGIHGIDVATNGIRTSIDLDTAKTMLCDDLEVYLKLQGTVLKTVKNTNTEYCKDIVKNLKLPTSEQTLNPYAEINRLTQQSISNISKDYRIQNDGEEVKEKK